MSAFIDSRGILSTSVTSLMRNAPESRIVESTLRTRSDSTGRRGTAARRAESVWEDYERLDAQSGPSLQRPFRSRARSCHAEHRAAERAIARNTASLIRSPCVGKRKTPGGSDSDRLWSRTIRSMAKCSLGRLEKKAPLGRSLSMLFDSIQAFSAIPVRPSPQAPIVEPMRRTRSVLQCL